MSKKTTPLLLNFENKVCINHLKLYQFDIDFTIMTGQAIIKNFQNSKISDKELVVQLRGYITTNVLSLCKLMEIIDFIKKSQKIEFNEDTANYIKKFIEESSHLKEFRNHYIAHPVKKDYVKKTEYLLPILESRVYINKFFDFNETNYNNETLIQKIQEQANQLNKYKILIDHVMNCIPDI